MSPLETSALQPPRCLAHTASPKVERGPDWDNRDLKSVSESIDEVILPGSAETDPENVCVAICHSGAEVAQFVVGEVPLGRALGANDFHPWRYLLESHGHVDGNPSIASI